MFKIEVIVEDNKLPKALMALDGLGYELQVHPIKEMKTATPQLGGTSVESVNSFLKTHLQKSGAAVATGQMEMGSGCNRTSTYYAIKELVKAGVLARTGRGMYTINPNKL